MDIQCDLMFYNIRQALIYPLTVASKSNATLRQAAANKILKSMCERSQTLVAQAMLVRIPYLLLILINKK